MNIHSNPQPTTILIVDDQVDNRDMLSVLLSSEGYRTVDAAGWMEYRKFKRHFPAVCEVAGGGANAGWGTVRCG